MDMQTRENLLPYDGEVWYFDKALDALQAAVYLEGLTHRIAWRHDEAVIFGRHIITDRLTAWYGDEAYKYTYSNITRSALPWTAELLKLKKLVSAVTGASYNSCLLNLYHSGAEGMAWHSDDEKDLVRGAAIASVSLGEARKFSFRHKRTGETLSLTLGHGSLLLMQGATQEHWLHALPKTKKAPNPRINVTFRTIAVPQPPKTTNGGN